MELLTIKGLQREVERMQNLQEHIETADFTNANRIECIHFLNVIIDRFTIEIKAKKQANNTEVIDPQTL